MCVRLEGGGGVVIMARGGSSVMKCPWFLVIGIGHHEEDVYGVMGHGP